MFGDCICIYILLIRDRFGDGKVNPGEKTHLLLEENKRFILTGLVNGNTQAAPGR